METTLLPLVAELRLMERVVVELMEPLELGELRFKSVMDLLLLLLDERTGSMVSEEPIETVVKAVLG